jgi:hypothetical protein
MQPYQEGGGTPLALTFFLGILFILIITALVGVWGETND